MEAERVHVCLQLTMETSHCLQVLGHERAGGEVIHGFEISGRDSDLLFMVGKEPVLLIPR